MKKEERVLRALGQVDDTYVEEAAPGSGARKKKRWNRWIAAAACLCLVAAGAFGAVQLGLIGGNAGAGGGNGNGITYMFYAGPVFPLTAAQEETGITAERSLGYDFSPYRSRTETYTDSEGKTVSYEAYDAKAVVTDEYVLRNESGEEKTMTLLYPFAAGLGSAADVKPVITAGGKPAETAWHIGAYGGTFSAPGSRENGDYSQLNSWEKYRALTEAGYQKTAFDSFPDLSQRVAVYEFRYVSGVEFEAAPALEVRVEYHIDPERTTVLSYGFNSGTYDAETGNCSRGRDMMSPEAPGYGETFYLIALGEDIGEFQMNTFAGGEGSTPFETFAAADGEGKRPADGRGGKTRIKTDAAEAVRYECTLGEILTRAAEQYLDVYEKAVYGEDRKALLYEVNREEFVGLAAEMMEHMRLLPGHQKERNTQGELEDIFSLTREADRVMYLSFEVTVPAGGEIRVAARMVKPASRDYPGGRRNADRNGYDMVTGLGSVLTFAKQTASVSNTDAVEILRQNFGFDLKKGITSVELNLDEPRYFLEVQKKRN
ncbi:MAG: hypothetical protein IJL66_07650 [Lachnospiraceae bacterium]|nr:hypothetical protein [Lachnospiraceae bacterium]